MAIQVTVVRDIKPSPEEMHLCAGIRLMGYTAKGLLVVVMDPEFVSHKAGQEGGPKRMDILARTAKWAFKGLKGVCIGRSKYGGERRLVLTLQDRMPDEPKAAVSETADLSSWGDVD